MKTFKISYELMPIKEKLSEYGLINGSTYLAPTRSILIQNSRKELFLDAISVFKNNPINSVDKYKYINNYSIVSIIDNTIVIEISSVFNEYLEPTINDELALHEPYIKIEKLLKPVIIKY